VSKLLFCVNPFDSLNIALAVFSLHSSHADRVAVGPREGVDGVLVEEGGGEGVVKGACAMTVAVMVESVSEGSVSGCEWPR